MIGIWEFVILFSLFFYRFESFSNKKIKYISEAVEKLEYKVDIR